MSVSIEGHCLCNAVKLKAKTVNTHVGACHCGMCRRWGGPLLAVDCGSDVDIEGAEHVSVFDSSAWAERGFCNQCGTHLFYHLKGNNQYIIPVGIFGDNPSFHFNHQVFIDKKPDFYDFANKTTDMTEAEIFAKYAPQSDDR